ncbi:MAG: RNA polymerase sporulation sigma factor SigE, partial [Clostridiales bacterium]
MNKISGKVYLWWSKILMRLSVGAPRVDYVGGSDILPPPLPSDEESKLLAALVGGDRQARQVLVEHNLRL